MRSAPFPVRRKMNVLIYVKMRESDKGEIAMNFVQPGAEFDVFMLILSIIMLIIFTFLAATLVYSCLKRGKQKPGYFIFYIFIVFGVIYQLIEFFRLYTWLGIAAIIIYITFGLIIFLALRKNRMK